MYSCEAQNKSGEWVDFIWKPFKTQVEAEQHRLLVLKEYDAFTPDQIRVTQYTEEQWRDYLINKIMEDEDNLRRELQKFFTHELTEMLHLEKEPEDFLPAFVVIWNYLESDSNHTTQKVYGPFDDYNVSLQWAMNHKIDETVNGGFIIKPINKAESYEAL